MAILDEPCKLDDAGMALMRTRAAEGHSMLATQGFEEAILRFARSRQEMLDGSGYHNGLRDVEIPDLVRSVTVCGI